MCYTILTRLDISIHVPREGDDPKSRQKSARQRSFLSTSPARGTTAGAGVLDADFCISIHVPREGDDAYLSI